MKKDEIREALAGFAGVNRRFTKVAEVNGVTIIDDYGHHPVEIAAVLKAARQATKGRIIAVHQPHRYTRLSSLFEEFCTCFNEADVVAIADVYAAGEDPIPGASRDDLVAGLIAHGHRHARALLDEADLARLVQGTGAAGRHGGLPWRGHDQRLGQCAARQADGRGGMREAKTFRKVLQIPSKEFGPCPGGAPHEPAADPWLPLGSRLGHRRDAADAARRWCRGWRC